VTDQLVLVVGNPPTFRLDVARALGTAPEDLEWVASAGAAEEALVEAGGRFALLVLSPEVDAPDALGLAESLGHRSPATAMVITRKQHPDGLIPLAMRAGVRDVVDLSRDELYESLQRALRWSSNVRSMSPGAKGEGGRRGRIFTVFSSKGGTGKSFLTTNLGVAVAGLGKKTAIVDLDLRAGDIFSLFGAEPSHSLRDLAALGPEADGEAALEFGKQLHENLWAFAATPDPAAEPIPAVAMTRTLELLRTEFDYLILDGTDDYDDHVLAAFDESDALCLITGLDLIGVRHLSLALETLLSLDLPRDRFRIVLNRADSKVGLAPEDVERVLKLRVDAMIPSSRLVPASVNRARPVTLTDPKSEVARAVVALANKLVQEQPVRKRSRFRRD